MLGNSKRIRLLLCVFSAAGTENHKIILSTIQETNSNFCVVSLPNMGGNPDGATWIVGQPFCFPQSQAVL